jgi:hypothetical protein
MSVHQHPQCRVEARLLLLQWRSQEHGNKQNSAPSAPPAQRVNNYRSAKQTVTDNLRLKQP